MTNKQRKGDHAQLRKQRRGVTSATICYKKELLLSLAAPDASTHECRGKPVRTGALLVLVGGQGGGQHVRQSHHRIRGRRQENGDRCSLEALELRMRPTRRRHLALVHLRELSELVGVPAHELHSGHIRREFHLHLGHPAHRLGCAVATLVTSPATPNTIVSKPCGRTVRSFSSFSTPCGRTSCF